MTGPSADAIDEVLPQTQCRRCGYDGCRPYAQALAREEAEINRCPPGGTATIEILARLTQRAPVPLDPECGAEGPALVALIDEARCIGCAKCLSPCPVDAIVGAGRQMHTVLMSICTGCELCIAPCPVDCITMIERPAAAAREPTPSENRARYQQRNVRIERRQAARSATLAARKELASGASSRATDDGA